MPRAETLSLDRRRLQVFGTDAFFANLAHGRAMAKSALGQQR